MSACRDVFSGVMHFPADHPVFEDHFPGDPVVPGSLLINAFLREARRCRPDFHPAGLGNFRFRHFVRPGSYIYMLECRRTPDGPVVRCALQDETGRRLATGELYG